MQCIFRRRLRGTGRMEVKPGSVRDENGLTLDLGLLTSMIQALIGSGY